MSLSLLYLDDHVVAVHKPAGLLVHRTLLDRHATCFALQTVRDQLGRKIYPVHRLDRATSGVLLFALSVESARALAAQFSGNGVKKIYLALVRGVPPKAARIDHPLKEVLDDRADALADPDKAAQSAVTFIETLKSCEFPVQVDKYPTSRYSLVRARPETGRKHQIRRHLRHSGHPIVGDVTHGVGKHNRFFREHFGVRRLFLTCMELGFPHPETGRDVVIQTSLDEDYRQILEQLPWLEPRADLASEENFG